MPPLAGAQAAAALDKYTAQQAHALVVAAYKGDLAAVQQLLADKVLPGSTSYDGKTALEVGFGRGSERPQQLPGARDRRESWVPLQG